MLETQLGSPHSLCRLDMDLVRCIFHRFQNLGTDLRTACIETRFRVVSASKSKSFFILREREKKNRDEPLLFFFSHRGIWLPAATTGQPVQRPIKTEQEVSYALHACAESRRGSVTRQTSFVKPVRHEMAEIEGLANHHFEKGKKMRSCRRSIKDRLQSDLLFCDSST